MDNRPIVSSTWMHAGAASGPGTSGSATPSLQAAPANAAADPVPFLRRRARPCVAEARRLARLFIGIATLAPAFAFLGLGVALATRGGAVGVVAGGFVALLGLGLVVAAVLMVRAPGAAAWFVKQAKDGMRPPRTPE